MIRLPPPTHLADNVYATCVTSKHSALERQQFFAARDAVMQAAADYTERARDETLYELPRCDGGEDEVVVGELTKRQLIGLYTAQMVPKGKPARLIYEQLRSRALHQICPLCGLGEVMTLDHYLAKAVYPIYSVCPSNLVPACRDCNIEKRDAAYSTPSSPPLHPYFDNDRFYEAQWLVAKVEHSSPVVVKFRAAPPATWPTNARDRVESHLQCYELRRRLSVRAAQELTTIGPELARINEPNLRREHLSVRADVALRVQKNSWKTAMFQALRDDRWYWEDGYLDTGGAQRAGT